MTQAELRFLYFDMKDTQGHMRTVGERLKKLESYDPKWTLRGKEMVGAAGVLASWMEALDNLISLIEIKDD